MTGAILELPHLDDQHHGAQLDAITIVARYMTDHGMTDRYALEPLHGHWPSFPGEALVQWLDGEVLRSRVATDADVTKMAPALWRVTADGGVEVLLWNEDQRAPAEVDPALPELARFLVDQGLHQTFGIVALPYRLKVGPNRVLLEKTDDAARTQATIVVNRNEVGDALLAGWRIAADGTVIETAFCHVHARKG